jgi:hypothetical protein
VIEKAIAGYCQGYRKAIAGYCQGYRKAIAGYCKGYRKGYRWLFILPLWCLKKNWNFYKN